jgi:GH24 family phage-related lysozyme (muramidase)
MGDLDRTGQQQKDARIMPTAARSSARATLLIVTEEDGDANYYIKTEENFSWPGGASGPTVAVGFDCGYETAASIETEWTGFIDAARIKILQTAAGIHGSAAEQFVDVHRHAITITWQEALAQFQGRELLKWEAIVEAHLPNTDLLSGDSFGALVSLTYNRGPSFDSPGSRYVEMRNIKAHMAAKAFDLIPNEFLAMRRLWPKGGDLWNRRGHEALLFRDGLIPAPVAPA